MDQILQVKDPPTLTLKDFKQIDKLSFPRYTNYVKVLTKFFIVKDPLRHHLTIMNRLNFILIVQNHSVI